MRTILTIAALSTFAYSEVGAFYKIVNSLEFHSQKITTASKTFVDQ